MDSSFEVDSPNTRDRKRFQCVGGEYTEEEKEFLIRNGFLAQGEDGEYTELSTIIDSDEESTDEEDENQEPKPRKSYGQLFAGSASSYYNKSVDESLGSLNVSSRSSNKSLERNGLSRILSPLVTNNAPSPARDDLLSSVMAKSSLLSPFGSEKLDTPNLDSSSGAISPEPVPTFSTEVETPVKWATDTAHGTESTPDRGMQTLPFASATPTPGKEGIVSVTAPTPDSSFTASPFAAETPGKEGIDAMNAPTPGSAGSSSFLSTPVPAGNISTMSTPGLEGIFSINAPPTPDSSFPAETSLLAGNVSSASTPAREEISLLHTPRPNSPTLNHGSPFVYGNDQSLQAMSTPAAVSNSIAMGDETPDNQSLANIQCPEAFSSPADFSSPIASDNTPRFNPALFQTPASYLSPASRNRLNKTVELMDISYGDVAEAIDANSSDASLNNDSSLKMDHPVEISEQYIEVPTNVQIIDEILDLKGGEQQLFLSQVRTDTEENFKELVPPYVPQTLNPQASEGSRHVTEILILEPRDESNEVFGLGPDDVVEDYINSATDTKGIDVMSPASVAEDISLNNTSNSFADISLDDISNGSFNLSDGEEDQEQLGPNESFRTCNSVVSTASYASCHEEDIEDYKGVEEGRSSVEPINEEVTEELDDTMTMVEKLLLQAEELEERESKGIDEDEESSAPYQMTSPVTPARSESLDQDPSLSPSIFATPKTLFKNKSPPGIIFATPAGPAPKAKNGFNPDGNYFSPASKPALPPTPPRVTTPLKSASPKPKGTTTPSSKSPSPKTTPRKLYNILDSPARKAVPPIPKVASPRGLRTPSKVGHPITSPVANYIYSVPPPVQVKKMIPPPKMHTTSSSPKTKVVDNTRIPRPKQSIPVLNKSSAADDAIGFRKPSRDTLTNLFPPTKVEKELASNINYVGPNNVKSVNGSANTPSRLPTPNGGITPVSDKHLGVRDSNNASMVTQQPVVRKFCPERTATK